MTDHSTSTFGMAAPTIVAYELCSGLGWGREQTLSALLEGRHGLSAPHFELPFATSVGAVSASLEPLPPPLARYDSRLTRMAAALLEGVSEPVERAVTRYGASRVGLFLGTSTAGILETEAAYEAWLSEGTLPGDYSFHDKHAYHPLLTVLRALSGVDGPGHVISTACSSSGKVFASAIRMMNAGLIDAALVGGVDTLCQTTLRGFFALGALATEPCRPFSADRAGITIGEGGALLLLERAPEGAKGSRDSDREAQVQVLGVGESSDAYHMSAPHPEGIGAEAAMAAAIVRAGLEPAAVDHVNAHGTGTKLNDAMESKAIARLLEDSIPVMSTKAYTGHLLGAAGALEAAIVAICIEEGFVPPALRVEPQDEGCQVRVPVEVERRSLRAVLSNSFAFGGHNVSVLLGRAP